MDRDLDIPLEGVFIRDIETGYEGYTDSQGIILLELPENSSRVIIVAELIGYEPRKQMVTDFSDTVLIKMLMEGVLEGQELVVEAEAIGETDEEVGVSTVVEQETVKSAAKMGVIEDALNAVKILPGVTYSGGFGTPISVRGGDPTGVTAVLDGFITKYPSHFMGAFSIFNPNIVESIKFSPGIFSTKHGQATSALLEVKTVDPTEGFKFSSIVSSSTLESFLQVPMGSNDQLGWLTGFRLTNWDLAIQLLKEIGNASGEQALIDTVSSISRAPFIYDFYLKALYTPSESFKWHVNGFWGNDGVGIKSLEVEDTTSGINSDVNVDFFNRDIFVTTGLKILPKDNLLITAVAGYEIWQNEVGVHLSEEGSRLYSQAFIDLYSDYYLSLIGVPMPGGFEIYTDTEIDQVLDNYGFQGRIDLDWSLRDNLLLQSGLGMNLEGTSIKSRGSFWGITSGDDPEYKNINWESESQDARTLLSFLYTNLNTEIVPDFLKMDLGCRMDHAFFLGQEGFTLNTYPELAPRVNFIMTPESKKGVFQDNSFSLGAGLFNKYPFQNSSFDENSGIEDFEIKSGKTLMWVLGWETYLPLDFRFKIESYYKYLYDRAYVNAYTNPDGSVEGYLHFDGIGHAGGGDFLLERKLSRRLDGMLSYTFVYARYMEPESDGIADEDRADFGTTAPRGEFYWPSFHRFHSLNVLLNIKPSNKHTLTTKLTYASGLPGQDRGDPIMFPALVYNREGDPQLAEMYSIPTYYSDTLRTFYSLVLDLKWTTHSFRKNSKIQWEYYLAVQDILAPLLITLQSREETINQWGEEEESPDFSFPMISFGLTLSY